VARDDVEALKAVYAEWARGNFWTPDIFHPEIELVWATEMPDLQGGEHRGLAGVERGMREWLEVWDDCRWGGGGVHFGGRRGARAVHRPRPRQGQRR
jgi:hypothetical protein